jgi:hypothetical protein
MGFAHFSQDFRGGGFRAEANVAYATFGKQSYIFITEPAQKVGDA